MTDEESTNDDYRSRAEQVPSANELEVVRRYRARQKERQLRLHGAKMARVRN